MADFAPALTKTLQSEGLFFDRSSTTGEVGNYGISLSFLRSIGQLPGAPGSSPSEAEIAFIKALTPDAASALYEAHFWNPLHLGEITDQRLAEKIFDLAVNTGPAQTVEMLQRAINKLNTGVPIADDGVMGPVTIECANFISKNASDQLYAYFKQEAMKFYQQLGQRRPEDRQFVAGWIARLGRA